MHVSTTLRMRTGLLTQPWKQTVRLFHVNRGVSVEMSGNECLNDGDAPMVHCVAQSAQQMQLCRYLRLFISKGSFVHGLPGEGGVLKSMDEACRRFAGDLRTEALLLSRPDGE